MSEKLTEDQFRPIILKPSVGVKILLCLFIGCLSTFFAEVLSGSFPLWYLNLFGLLFVLPLYMLHLLFLLNLAIKSKRTSIPQLYLWGIIFALYESWITKVLWFGYPNEQSAQFGLFLGIAWGEFLVLVFFFHPIFSFIIPILVFQLFAVSSQSNNEFTNIVLPSHLNFMKKNKKVNFFVIFAIVLGACFIPISLGYNIFTVFLATLGNIALILILYFFCKLITRKNRFEFSINSLKLGKLGLTIVIIVLIILYIFTFFVFSPERLPTTITPYFIIIGFYIFIIIMIIISKPSNENNIDLSNVDKILNIKELILFLGILTILAIIMCFLPALAFIIGIFTYLAMLIVGCAIFAIIIFCFIKKGINK